MKKALIFGISGQDGSYLAKYLLENNYQVYGTSRNVNIDNVNYFFNLNALNIFGNISLHSVDISDPRAVKGVIAEIVPDEIYNLAGQSSVAFSFKCPEETRGSIVDANLHVLKAISSISNKIKYYHSCSSECFGNTNENAADENTPFSPLSPYAQAKAEAFVIVKEYREKNGLFACNGILFNHESPLRPDHFVTKKIVSAACRIVRGSKEKLELGNIEVCRDWGWAPEYVEAMWLMLQQSEPRDCVIATGETNSLKEFLQAAFTRVNLNWTDHVKINRSMMRSTDIVMSKANPDKAKIILGWQAQNKMADVARMMVEAQLVGM